MGTPTANPAPLVPTLPDVADKRLRHQLADLRGGDQFHFTARALGFPKGAVVPAYGKCVYYDPETGQPYAVTAYVRGGSEAVPYAERQAVKYRTAHQKEQWFGSVLLFLTEIDLTDYADVLRLERVAEPLAQLLYPELAEAA